MERRILSRRPRGIWPGLAVFQPSPLIPDYILLLSRFNAVPHASLKPGQIRRTGVLQHLNIGSYWMWWSQREHGSSVRLPLVASFILVTRSVPPSPVTLHKLTRGARVETPLIASQWKAAVKHDWHLEVKEGILGTEPPLQGLMLSRGNSVKIELQDV